MIFTSFEFIAFFTLVAIGLHFCRKRSSTNRLLLIASYAFYMSWNYLCGGLILFTSLVDYFVANKIGATSNEKLRIRLLTASICVNLGILVFFKYAGFLVGNAAWALSTFGVHVDKPTLEIVLPVGISFFTFQSMSYTIDVFRRRLTPCSSVRDYLLFVSFFPQLVAGPIVRASDLLPQLLTNRIRPTTRDLEAGLAQFGLGAVKKLVISDQISPFVDPVFANPGAYDGPTLVLMLVGYAAQIYCDFSGYSDMAIGSARLMGYRFSANFAMPYQSTSISEFWHRWHISLSTWLRDYLYIPLGGNRKGTARTYLNLMVTMLLGGLWHGASWNFIIWGGIHGIALCVNRWWSAHFHFIRRTPSWMERIGAQVLSHFLTIGTVLLGWVFFRCQTLDASLEYLWRMGTLAGDGSRSLSPNVVAAVGAVVLVHLFARVKTCWVENLVDKGLPVRVVAYSFLVMSLVLFGATESAPFIYFQF